MTCFSCVLAILMGKTTSNFSPELMSKDRYRSQIFLISKQLRVQRGQWKDWQECKAPSLKLTFPNAPSPNSSKNISPSRGNSVTLSFSNEFLAAVRLNDGLLCPEISVPCASISSNASEFRVIEPIWRSLPLPFFRRLLLKHIVATTAKRINKSAPPPTADAMAIVW